MVLANPTYWSSSAANLLRPHSLTGSLKLMDNSMKYGTILDSKACMVLACVEALIMRKMFKLHAAEDCLKYAAVYAAPSIGS